MKSRLIIGLVLVLIVTSCVNKGPEPLRTKRQSQVKENHQLSLRKEEEAGLLAYLEEAFSIIDYRELEVGFSRYYGDQNRIIKNEEDVKEMVGSYMLWLKSQIIRDYLQVHDLSADDLAIEAFAEKIQLQDYEKFLLAYVRVTYVEGY